MNNLASKNYKVFYDWASIQQRTDVAYWLWPDQLWVSHTLQELGLWFTQKLWTKTSLLIVMQCTLSMGILLELLRSHQLPTMLHIHTSTLQEITTGSQSTVWRMLANSHSYHSATLITGLSFRCSALYGKKGWYFLLEELQNEIRINISKFNHLYCTSHHTLLSVPME